MKYADDGSVREFFTSIIESLPLSTQQKQHMNAAAENCIQKLNDQLYFTVGLLRLRREHEGGFSWLLSEPFNLPHALYIIVLDNIDRQDAENEISIYDRGAGNNQNLIAAALESAKPGDKIIVPNGIFAEDTLFIPENVHISGRNRTKIVGSAYPKAVLSTSSHMENLNFHIYECAETYKNFAVIYVSEESKDVRLTNIHVTGDMNLTHPFGIGIKIEDNASATLTSVTVSNMPESGIVVGENASVEFVSCLVSENHHNGVWLRYSAQSTLTNCRVVANRYHGLYVDALRCVLENCDLKENKVNGVHFDVPRASSVLKGVRELHRVENCTFRANEVGIVVTSGARVEVLESEFTQNMEGGVIFENAEGVESDGSVKNCTFKDNCSNSETHEISIEKPYRIATKNNVFHGDCWSKIYRQ